MIISDELLQATIDAPHETQFWRIALDLWADGTETNERLGAGWNSISGRQLPAYRAAVNALRPYEQAQLLNAIVLARLTS